MNEIKVHELKPCKCGGESVMTSGYAVYLFECKVCGKYLVSQDPIDTAIETWNKTEAV